MKKTLVLMVLLCLAFSVPAWSLPLPTHLSGTFAGRFNEIPIWGDIVFDLDHQWPVPNESASHVSWNFTATATNQPFAMEGFIFNDEYIEFQMYESGTDHWDASLWGGYVSIEESISGALKHWGAVSSPVGFGPDWDLITNENFLPYLRPFELWGGEDYEYNGTLAFDFRVSPDAAQPVPEPATLLLTGAGLLGAAIRRRRG